MPDITDQASEQRRKPAHWTHDRNIFFKYVSPESIKKILLNRTLRWSRPTLFNDPFDVQFDLHLNIDPAIVEEQCLDLLWKAWSFEVEYFPANKLGALFDIYRKQARAKNIIKTREEFYNEQREGISEGIHNGNASLPLLQAHFRESGKDAKILSLTEVHDNILMWSHYAEHHKGAVLELRCVEQLDSEWGAARPINYSSNMPRLFDNSFLARMISGQANIDSEKVLHKLIYTKAAAWSYEKEWRVIIHGQNPSEDVRHINFNPAELSAVYFGCRMEDSVQQELSSTLAKDFPDTRSYRATKNPREFKLDFSEITGY